MKVSIIIPIGQKDKEQTLKIKTMFDNQSMKPDEIIFVGEGNIPFARNKGAREARNDYLLQCDAGTTYPFDYVEKMCLGFEKSDFVSGRFYLYNDKYQNFFIRKNYGSTRCIGYSKALFNKIGGYNEQLFVGEDTDFNIRASKFAKMHITDAVCFWQARSNLKELAKQFYLYGKGDKIAGNVKSLAYAIPILLIGEVIFHSLKLLKYIWIFRINYWLGIIK